MPGQRMSNEQRATFLRLRRKGWRGEERDMFALAVPMYYDRPHPTMAGASKPHVVHIRRDGTVHRGYPGASKGNRKYRGTA